MGKSEVEETLLGQLRMAGVPPPLRNYRFAKPRRWELDFVWIDRGPDYSRVRCGEDCDCQLPNVAVEVDGGLWPSRQEDGSLAVGRHVRPKGYEEGVRKANEAVRRGYELYRVTPSMVESGEALRVIEEALLQSQQKEEA